MRPGSGCGYREALLSRKKCSPLTVRDVVRGTVSVAGLGGPSRPVDILPFNFCCCVYTLRLFGMNATFQTCLCCVKSFRRTEGGCSPLFKVVRGAVELV